MTLKENMVTTRQMFVRGADRIEYIRSACQSHVEEIAEPSVDCWAVSLTEDDSFDAAVQAARELWRGNDNQWDNCVELWCGEVEL